MALRSSIRSKVNYELIGFNGEVVNGEHITIDSLSASDISIMKDELGDVIMSGIALDEILAEEIIRTYFDRVIGLSCIDESALWSALERQEDGIYRLGNVNVSLSDATGRILSGKEMVNAN